MIILNRREKLRASALPPVIPDGDTLVKKTDKASVSKLGLVKIGDNVNISSGGAISVPVGSAETAGVFKVGENLSVDENGALSASAGSAGLTADVLYDGNLTSANSSTPIVLAHPVTDYKFILFIQHDSGNSVGSTIFYVPFLTFNTSSGNNTPYPTTFKAFRFPDENDKTKMTFPSISSTLSGIAIIGIK